MTIPLTAFRVVPACWRTPATAIAHVTQDIHKQRDAVKAVTEILCLNRHRRMYWIWPELQLVPAHELNICVNSPSELVHASCHDYIPVCNVPWASDGLGALAAWKFLWIYRWGWNLGRSVPLPPAEGVNSNQRFN